MFNAIWVIYVCISKVKRQIMTQKCNLVFIQHMLFLWTKWMIALIFWFSLTNTVLEIIIVMSSIQAEIKSLDFCWYTPKRTVSVVHYFENGDLRNINKQWRHASFQVRWKHGPLNSPSWCPIQNYTYKNGKIKEKKKKQSRRIGKSHPPMCLP